MEIYKIGKIVSIGKDYIILETNYVGNIIYVSNTKIYKENEIRKIFIYNYQTEFSKSIYGFASFKERILFGDLISISGIGPKTAIGLLREGYDSIIDMIASKNANALSQLPYIGLKTSNQLIFELSEKYENISKAQHNKQGLLNPLQAKESLKILGFNKEQIEYAIKKIKPMETIEQLVEQAIKEISNAKFT